jgi:hypothetical protein
MGLTNPRGVVRKADRVVKQIRARVATVLYRGQLGPGTESEAEVMASRTWHNHRSL